MKNGNNWYTTGGRFAVFDWIAAEIGSEISHNERNISVDFDDDSFRARIGVKKEPKIIYFQVSRNRLYRIRRVTRVNLSRASHFVFVECQFPWFSKMLNHFYYVLIKLKHVLSKNSCPAKIKYLCQN